MKTLDINAKEWFDKVNGNSYFSGTITIDYGMVSEKNYSMPFQYGYGDHYKDMAMQKLIAEKEIDIKRHDNGTYQTLWSYCKEKNIILRTNKQEGCLKRELAKA